MKRMTSVLVVLLMAAGLYAQAITVAQALQIGNALASGATTSETYTIEGYVNVIKSNDYNTNYNNMTFWMADTRGSASSSATGALQVWRGRPDRELVEGDKVRVVAKLKKYNSTIETDPTNAPVTWLESAGDTPQDTVRGSLRVCAQNLQNYYYNLNTGRGNYTPAEFVAKTRKIVNTMLTIDADIYAFCEVEAQPIVLQQLADSMNAHAGAAGRYAAVSDNISVTWSESADYNIKSGFIYRTDKVATVGVSTGGTSGNGYYAHTMRIQTFKQLSNNEKLVVSMNHFKAKDNTADGGESTRVTNANNLISALSNISSDPDKLVLGDMNSLISEAPMVALVNAGYTEQLLAYDAYAYSHCYSGGELIDHVFANESMASQIVNAYVKHVCTYKCTSSVTQAMSYSDHDPYVVEINLESEEEQVGPCADIDVTYLTSEMAPMTTSDASIWKWSTYNNDSYAKASKQGGHTGYLITPTMNMADMQSVSLSFQHAHKFAGTPSEELTLWVTADYQGSFEESEWQKLTINPYSSNTNWNFVTASVDVPAAYLGTRTAFAFKYMSTASNYATWEIKNLHITGTCGQSGTMQEEVQEAVKARKLLENGQLILVLPDGTKYNVIGLRVQ